MNASHDIGSTMQGAPTQHPEAPCLFICPSFHGDQAVIELRRGISKWVGDEIEVTDDHLKANVCFFVGCGWNGSASIPQSNWAILRTFFERFGNEAKVYEWLRLEKFFRARDMHYFLVPGRIYTPVNQLELCKSKA